MHNIAIVLAAFACISTSLTTLAQEATAPDQSDLVVQSVGTADLALFGQSSNLRVLQTCYVLDIDAYVLEYWLQGTMQSFIPLGQGRSRPHTREDKAVFELTDDTRRKRHVRINDRTVPVLVKSYPNFTAAYIEGRLNLMIGRGEIIRVEHWSDDSWAIRVKENALDALYTENWVEHVEPGPYPPRRGGHLENSKTDLAQQINTTTTPPTYLLSGEASAPDDEIRVGLADGGIFRTHEEFTPKTLYACECYQNPSYDFFEGCPSDNDTPQCVSGVCDTPDDAQCGFTGHATLVAHVTAGDGGPSATGDYDLRGHAPNARLGDYPPYWDRQDLAAVALNTHSTDVSAHPYESSRFETYSALDVATDRLIRGATMHGGVPLLARPQTWAAGTDCNGTIRSVNKNGIVVGIYDIEGWCSVEGTGDSFAYGPTPDGRVKPDFVLPGVRDFEVADVKDDCCVTDEYKPQLILGTSEGTGIVAGVIALIVEALGPQRTGFEYPATYKAVLAQSAQDVGVKGPEHKTGFGVVDAQAATSIAASQNHWAEGKITHNTKHKYCITESVDHSQVRVALAWDDLQTCASTTNRLGGVITNDLDLRVTGPGTTAYAITPPGTITSLLMPGDHKNNVEVVDFETSSAGNSWTVEVRGTSLQTEQSYGIASSHHIEYCGAEEITLIPKSFVSNSLPDEFFQRPVDVDKLCPYVVECSKCTGGPIGLCAEFTTTLSDLPKDASVSLLNAEGKTVSKGVKRGRRQKLTIPSRLKTEKFFLSIEVPNPNETYRVRLSPNRSALN